jgi:Domain of unknown function (DUF5655)
MTVRDHLHRVPEPVADLYRRFERLVRSLGPVELAPVKTRIGFKARVTFAAAFLSPDHLEAHVVLARRLDHPRFVSVESIGGRHVHRFRVERPADLDDEVRGWLAEAYRVGLRRPQAPGRPSRRRIPNSRS